MAIVNGFITNGTLSVNFSADGNCTGGPPEGAISGVINNVFTGGLVLEDFTFASATPILVGINQPLDMIHFVYRDVTVTNLTTGDIFTNGVAIVTTVSNTANTWRGSISLVFGDQTVLTFFGLFTGSTIEDATVICQELL